MEALFLSIRQWLVLHTAHFTDLGLGLEKTSPSDPAPHSHGPDHSAPPDPRFLLHGTQRRVADSRPGGLEGALRSGCKSCFCYLLAWQPGASLSLSFLFSKTKGAASSSFLAQRLVVCGPPLPQPWLCSQMGRAGCGKGAPEPQPTAKQLGQAPPPKGQAGSAKTV